MPDWIKRAVEVLVKPQNPPPPSAQASMPRASESSLDEQLRQVSGKWVAIAGTALVAVRETPDALIADLRERGIRGATIMRAPSELDVELVGMG